MVELKCPLCCNESFDSHSSLKSHIDRLLANLECPLCKGKFTELNEFLTHLEKECEFCEESEEETAPLGDNEDTEVGESILAKALLEGKQCKEEGTEVGNEYYCQACDLHFNEIDAHLEKYHEGEEIVVEEEESLPATANEDGSLLLVVSEDSTSEEKPPTAPHHPIQESIKDKDGRLYTRKFVKIDKFWLEKEEKEEEEEEDESSVVKVSEVSMCGSCNVYYPHGDTSHANCASHTCTVCNTAFPSFKSLRLHRRMHDPIKTREIEAPASYEEGEDAVREMFVCKVCHKTYDKEYEQVHLSSHSRNNGYNCDVCNRKFFTKTNLEMHMKAHSNNKKFTCSYCKKPFVTYDALNDHLMNQCQKRPYACQYCGRRFTRPHEKVKHERIHTGEKPYVCDICGKSFRVSYCLTLHLRTHSGTRPYYCSECGKRFKSHSVYNHHLLTHSDIRNYKCPYCPKAFKTSVQLAGHKNSHIKPFTCTECNRPFASLYAVRAHMEIHKRDNNLRYECWICGALYSRAFALRDHLKQHHQQSDGDGEKEKKEDVAVEEEMEAASSILVNEDGIILGLDETTSIEIIENEPE